MPTPKYQTVQRSCPICTTSYETLKELPAPTCGNPNCIRSAREQGLPFTTPSRQLKLSFVKPKKRTHGNSKKAHTK